MSLAEYARDVLATFDRDELALDKVASSPDQAGVFRHMREYFAGMGLGRRSNRRIHAAIRRARFALQTDGALRR